MLTTGTFLRGVIHVGSQARPAGRMPAAASGGAASAAAAADAADTVAAMAAGSLEQDFCSLGGLCGILGGQHMRAAAARALFLFIHIPVK